MKKKLLIWKGVFVAVFFILSNIVSGQEAVGADFYKSIAFDGIWGENFSNNAIYYQGSYKRVYSGWVDTYGNLVVGFIDLDSKSSQSHILEKESNSKADECAFSLTMAPDGRLILFVANSNIPGVISMYTMKQSEQIDQWEKDDVEYMPGNNIAVKKVTALMLADAGNQLNLFLETNPSGLYHLSSADLGNSWANRHLDFRSNDGSPMQWNHICIESNRENRVAIAFLSGNEGLDGATISLAYLEDGNILNVMGERIASDANGIKEQFLSSMDAGSSDLMDIAFDEDNQPVVVFKTHTDKSQIINYSSWKDGSWDNMVIPLSGYVETLSLDKSNPRELYYSSVTDSVLEINKAMLQNKGRRSSWKSEPITTASRGDNMLPSVVVNASMNGPSMVTWLYQPIKDSKVNQLASIKINLRIPLISDVFDGDQIQTIMRNVADWQLSNPYTGHDKTNWQWGAFYTGLIAAYEVTQDNRYLDEMMNVGRYFQWGLHPDVLHADRLLISDMYVYLYSIFQDHAMLRQTRWAFDLHLSRRAVPGLSHKPGETYRGEWWTWCDALYMAPPSFYHFANIVDEEKYREYAYKHWKLTTDYLYSKDDSLFWRDDRYFDSVSENGSGLFWSRGNGWVIGGIARILSYLPVDHPQRDYYTDLFEEMASRLLRIQLPDGLWTVSLLDPDYLPKGESSGSAFFGFALAWGINNGILDPEMYTPAVKNAWKSLSAYVNDAGRLGYVQQIAGDPYPFYEHQWQVYASGAYLLFAREMLELLKD